MLYIIYVDTYLWDHFENIYIHTIADTTCICTYVYPLRVRSDYDAVQVLKVEDDGYHEGSQSGAEAGSGAAGGHGGARHERGWWRRW